MNSQLESVECGSVLHVTVEADGVGDIRAGDLERTAITWLHETRAQTSSRGFYSWQFPRIDGTQYKPQSTIVLILGTPEMVPHILANPQFSLCFTWSQLDSALYIKFRTSAAGLFLTLTFVGV